MTEADVLPIGEQASRDRPTKRPSNRAMAQARAARAAEATRGIVNTPDDAES